MLFFEYLKSSLSFFDVKDKFISQDSELSIGLADIFSDREDRIDELHGHIIDYDMINIIM